MYPKDKPKEQVDVKIETTILVNVDQGSLLKSHKVSTISETLH
jgi:hypothetical protein